MANKKPTNKILIQEKWQYASSSLYSFLDMTFDDTIAELEGIRRQILEKYPEAIDIKTDLDYTRYDSMEVTVYYSRMETDDEFEHRLKIWNDDKIKKRNLSAQVKKDEVELLEKLAKKHGKKLV